MATFQEIEAVLKKLTEASKEAKKATAEAHAARKDLHKAIKDSKEAIADAILAQVTEAVSVIEKDVAQDMKARVDLVIDELAADWRKALKIDG